MNSQYLYSRYLSAALLGVMMAQHPIPQAPPAPDETLATRRVVVQEAQQYLHPALLKLIIRVQGVPPPDAVAAESEEVHRRTTVVVPPFKPPRLATFVKFQQDAQGDELLDRRTVVSYKAPYKNTSYVCYQQDAQGDELLSSRRSIPPVITPAPAPLRSVVEYKTVDEVDELLSRRVVLSGKETRYLDRNWLAKAPPLNADDELVQGRRYVQQPPVYGLGKAVPWSQQPQPPEIIDESLQSRRVVISGKETRYLERNWVANAPPLNADDELLARRVIVPYREPYRNPSYVRFQQPDEIDELLASRRVVLSGKETRFDKKHFSLAGVPLVNADDELLQRRYVQQPPIYQLGKPVVTSSVSPQIPEESVVEANELTVARRVILQGKETRYLDRVWRNPVPPDNADDELLQSRRISTPTEVIPTAKSFVSTLNPTGDELLQSRRQVVSFPYRDIVKVNRTESGPPPEEEEVHRRQFIVTPDEYDVAKNLTYVQVRVEEVDELLPSRRVVISGKDTRFDRWLFSLSGVPPDNADDELLARRHVQQPPIYQLGKPVNTALAPQVPEPAVVEANELTVTRRVILQGKETRYLDRNWENPVPPPNADDELLSRRSLPPVVSQSFGGDVWIQGTPPAEIEPDEVLQSRRVNLTGKEYRYLDRCWTSKALPPNADDELLQSRRISTAVEQIPRAQSFVSTLNPTGDELLPSRRSVTLFPAQPPFLLSRTASPQPPNLVIEANELTVGRRAIYLYYPPYLYHPAFYQVPRPLIPPRPAGRMILADIDWFGMIAADIDIHPVIDPDINIDPVVGGTPSF